MKRVEKFEGVLNGVKYDCKCEFMKALEELQKSDEDIKEIRYGTTVSYEDDECPLPCKPAKKVDLDYLLPDWDSIEKAIAKIQEGTPEESDKITANIENNMADHLKNLVQNSEDWLIIKDKIKERASEIIMDCKSTCDVWDSDRKYTINTIEDLKEDLHLTENVIKFLSDYAGYAECVKEYIETIS